MGGAKQGLDGEGLYARARSGQIANFTAVDSPYETPEQAEVHLETTLATPEESVSELIADRARLTQLRLEQKKRE